MNSVVKRRLLTNVGCSVLVLALPNGHAAQASAASETERTLQEVIVTAQKQKQSLQEVPETVTAISSDELTKAGIRGIGDIQSEVTNLNLAKSQTNTINAVIRGVGSFRNVNGVGFFFDDVQDFNAYAQPLFDLDHVEVLKGPQGTLYGGLNIGGAIKYVLKQPRTDEWGGDAQLVAGDYGQNIEAAGASGPLSQDVAVRLSAYHQHVDGIFYNTFNNSKTGDNNNYGGRLALLGHVGSLRATLDLRANHLNTTRQQLLTSAQTPDSYDLRVFAQDHPYNRVTSVTPTLQLDYGFGSGYTLTSLTSYNYTSTNSLSDSETNAPPPGTDYPYLPLLKLFVPFWDRSEQQELRLASPGDGPITWMLGGYYLHRDLDGHNRYTILENTSFVPVRTIPVNNDYIFKEYAAFGTATYKFTDHWQASLGLRENHSENTFTDFFANETILRGGARVVIPAGTPSKVSGTQLLPRGELDYHFNPDVMLYGSVSRGVSPGGAAVAISPTGQPFDSEWTTAYELGEKADLLGHRLRLNAAAFYTLYTHRTFTAAMTLPGQAPIRINTNIGDSRNIGFEMDATAAPLPGLILHAGIGYVSAKWIGPLNYTSNNFLTHSLISADIGGNYAPATPDWTANASAEWTHPLTGDLALRLRGDAAYVGRQYWDLFDTYSSSPYTIVNLSAGFDYRNWMIFAEVKNVGDTKYNLDWLPARDTGAPINLANPGDPRMYTVTVSTRF